MQKIGLNWDFLKNCSKDFVKIAYLDETNGYLSNASGAMSKKIRILSFGADSRIEFWINRIFSELVDPIYFILDI